MADRLLPWMLTINHRDGSTERMEFVAVDGMTACEAVSKRLAKEGRMPVSVFYDNEESKDD